jgi:DNA-binding transcriptional regulator GbsR (MarR family)
MDHTTATFVDGLGAAAATSGVLTQQQGRIFALLYLSDEPLSLEQTAIELDQSKSNVSLNIRALVEWHLVRRKPVAGSRKDHYEAASDFFRAMQEIFERRFRWTVRQVLSTVDETKTDAARRAPPRQRKAFLDGRLGALRAFFSLVDGGIGMFVDGKAFPADRLKTVVSASASGAQGRRSS